MAMPKKTKVVQTGTCPSCNAVVGEKHTFYDDGRTPCEKKGQIYGG